MIINNEGEQEPFQVFAAISENILDRKVTGLVDGKRIYELPLCEKGEWDYKKLIEKASKLTWSNWENTFAERNNVLMASNPSRIPILRPVRGYDRLLRH